MRHYTVVLIPDEESGYTVEVPMLPGCLTQGDTLEEALANAKEAIEVWLEAQVDLGRPIPEERERPQAITIAVNPDLPIPATPESGEDLRRSA